MIEGRNIVGRIWKLKKSSEDFGELIDLEEGTDFLEELWKMNRMRVDVT
jgi:hypothetical protein